MTTEPLLSADVCRVTVIGPGSRADLAVPATLTVSALLPVLLDRVKEPAENRGKPWVLQRLGEAPLDPDGTPESLNLRHGEVLHLRPADEPLPQLHFDDVADGVAQVISARPDRWHPQATRRLALALAAVALLALAWALLGFGPGASAAGGAGAVAVLLAVGCVLAHRFGADQGAVVLAGVAALVFAALAGLTFRHGPHGGFAPGEAGMLVAAAAVVVSAGALLALGPLPLVVPGTALVTALAAGIGAALMRTTHWHGGQAVAVVAVAMFVLGHFGPRLTLRMARLRVPQLPHDAEELQQDIEPEPQHRVERRVNAANAYLNTLSLSSALLYTVAFWFMARESGWIGWVLPPAFGGAILLRARGLSGTLQRVPMVTAGTLGLALLLLLRAAPHSQSGRAGVVVVLLLAAIGLLVAAWRLPNSRLLPIWGQTGDILETVSAIALLPLLLQVLHVYAYFRSLAS
jgi:type VII secretion integral membrane protein EccD